MSHREAGWPAPVPLQLHLEGGPFDGQVADPEAECGLPRGELGDDLPVRYTRGVGTESVASYLLVATLGDRAGCYRFDELDTRLRRRRTRLVAYQRRQRRHAARLVIVGLAAILALLVGAPDLGGSIGRGTVCAYGAWWLGSRIRGARTHGWPVSRVERPLFWVCVLGASSVGADLMVWVLP